MLNAAEIAMGYQHGTYQDFCEIYGVDKSRIAGAERQRQSGAPDGLFCALDSEVLDKRQDRGMAEQKPVKSHRYADETQPREGEAA